MNWPSSTTPSERRPTLDISRRYSRRGERVLIVDGSGTIDYSWNNALQLQTETHPRCNGPHVIIRTHETNGTGTVAERISGVRLQSPGAPAYRLDYRYDAFGRHSTFTSHHGDTQRTATSRFSDVFEKYKDLFE